MKVRAILIMSIFLSILVISCKSQNAVTESNKYENGTYRGIYADKDSIEVNVQFTLKDGIVTSASFRHLKHDDFNLKSDKEPNKSIVQQYHEILNYLVGKNLEKHLRDLYKPADIVETKVDGVSSATIRSSKIISAIKDALNRGVYSY